MRFTDSVQQAGEVRRTKEGFLAASVLCARTGIQEYSGREMGLDQDIVRIYRPANEVFKKKSLATFVGKPATDDHPPVAVNKDNWKDFAVGSIGEEVARDGEYVRVSLALMDGDVVNKVEAGKRELSMGYSMALDWTAGTTDKGEAYDAVMTDIEINHIAVVDRGRAGPRARVGDNWRAASNTPKSKPRPKAKTKSKKAMDVRTVLVDGLSVETTDAGAQAIEKLQADLKTVKDEASDLEDQHQAAFQTLKDSHKTEIGDKDTKIGELKAKVKELEDAQIKPEDLSKMVADRSVLETKAKQILGADADLTGKSDADIRRECVTPKYGADAVTAEDSDDMVAGMFKGITVDAFADAIGGRGAPPTPNASGVSDSQALYEMSVKTGKSVQELVDSVQKH